MSKRRHSRDDRELLVDEFVGTCGKIARRIKFVHNWWCDSKIFDVPIEFFDSLDVLSTQLGLHHPPIFLNVAVTAFPASNFAIQATAAEEEEEEEEERYHFAALFGTFETSGFSPFRICSNT